MRSQKIQWCGSWQRRWKWTKMQGSTPFLLELTAGTRSLCWIWTRHLKSTWTSLVLPVNILWWEVWQIHFLTVTRVNCCWWQWTEKCWRRGITFTRNIWKCIRIRRQLIRSGRKSWPETGWRSPARRSRASGMNESRKNGTRSCWQQNRQLWISGRAMELIVWLTRWRPWLRTLYRSWWTVR